MDHHGNVHCGRIHMLLTVVLSLLLFGRLGWYSNSEIHLLPRGGREGEREREREREYNKGHVFVNTHIFENYITYIFNESRSSLPFF